MAERAPSLPPLAALRAFDAAARHLSFTRAAEELFVTQTAVSHQIRILEDWIGFPLFKRINNRLTLTERGDIYLKAVHEGFNRIRNSTAALRSNEVGTILTISALPNFALNWLVPRLPDFAGKYPHIEVRLFMHRHSLDLLHDGIDQRGRGGAGLDQHRPGDRNRSRSVRAGFEDQLRRRVRRQLLRAGKTARDFRAARPGAGSLDALRSGLPREASRAGRRAGAVGLGKHSATPLRHGCAC